jgi:hypothetical protein
VCADSERWQLHFHKNGSMDNPVRIPPPSSLLQAVLTGQPMNNTLGSAAPPAHEEGSIWRLHDILDSTAHDNLPIGRNEVHMALTTILQNQLPREVPFAVDITSTTVFPWHRWLSNVVTLRSHRAMCDSSAVALSRYSRYVTHRLFAIVSQIVLDTTSWRRR